MFGFIIRSQTDLIDKRPFKNCQSTVIEMVKFYSQIVGVVNRTWPHLD
jgi:hypothetical protein